MKEYKKGLVSVIIPCYNQELYISEAIQSVIDQTYDNWECIIIDDGSDDASAEIINGFVNKDSRFKYIFQNNQGVSVARNAGFKSCNGEFIQFLDGDDFIYPEKLEKQLFQLNKYPKIDAVYSNFFHYYQGKNLYESYELTKIDDLLRDVLFKWDRNFNIPIHAPLFKRIVWNDSELPYPGAYKGRYEDWVFWVLLGLKRINLLDVDENLASYRIHDTNFTSNTKNKSINAIKATFYIATIIPPELRDSFIENSINFYIEEVNRTKILEEYTSTLAWKIGKKISPFFFPLIPKFLKKKYHIKK